MKLYEEFESPRSRSWFETDIVAAGRNGRIARTEFGFAGFFVLGVPPSFSCDSLPSSYSFFYSPDQLIWRTTGFEVGKENVGIDAPWGQELHIFVRPLLRHVWIYVGTGRLWSLQATDKEPFLFRIGLKPKLTPQLWQRFGGFRHWIVSLGRR